MRFVRPPPAATDEPLGRLRSHGRSCPVGGIGRALIGNSELSVGIGSQCRAPLAHGVSHGSPPRRQSGSDEPITVAA